MPFHDKTLIPTDKLLTSRQILFRSDVLPLQHNFQEPVGSDDLDELRLQHPDLPDELPSLLELLR